MATLTGNSYDVDGNFFPNDSGGFKELLYSQQDATFWGLEGQIHWHVFEGMNGRFGVNAQADYVRADLRCRRQRAAHSALSDRRRHFLREPQGWRPKFGVLYHGEQDKVCSERDADRQLTRRVDASATIHLFEGSGGDVDLVLTGTNLTDSVGRNAVSFTKDFVELPGRTFRLMLHFAR